MLTYIPYKVREVARKAYFVEIHQISLLSDSPLTVGFDYPLIACSSPTPFNLHTGSSAPVRNHKIGLCSLPAAKDIKNAKWQKLA